MTVVDRNLQAYAVVADHGVAGIEPEDVELIGDQPQPLNCRGLAATQPAQGMDLQRDVDHVAEVLGQIARQPGKILSPPCIVDIGYDCSSLGHDFPPTTEPHPSMSRTYTDNR